MDSSDESVESMQMVIKRSLLAKNKLAIIMKNPNGMIYYSCVECSAKYEDKEELQEHLLIHDQEYRFICGICGTGLRRKEHLDRHTLEHQELRPHVCADCGKGFKRKEHLNIHRTIHSGDKTEACPVCDKTFYRKDHLRKHLQTHTKVFLDQNVDAVSNLDKVHVVIKEELMLDDDIKQEDRADDDEEQIMETLEENYSMTEEYIEAKSVERPFMCAICKKSYKRKDHLKIHSWTHMKKDKICSVCGKAFHIQEQLLAHMTLHMQAFSAGNDTVPDNSLLIARSIHQSQDRRPHECSICQRRFKRKQHLKVHLNIHSRKQHTVWCSVCGEGFASNEQFESHQCVLDEQEDGTQQYEEDGSQQYEEDPVQNTPQEAKKENKYPTEFMDVTELAALDNVQYVDVEETLLPTPQRVFVCKYCSKPFKRKDHYKIHLHIHTGVRSFFCPECGKGFYRKDHMQKHMLVHKPKPKKEIPDLYPINVVPKKKEVKPEITIHAPLNTKLRVPLQIKVPYQMVVSLDNGEQRAVTIDPASTQIAS